MGSSYDWHDLASVPVMSSKGGVDCMLVIPSESVSDSDDDWKIFMTMQKKILLQL